MTPRGTAIGRRLAADLETLGEHARDQPAEADAIVCALVAHLRAWRPESVSPLGTLPAPTESIHDPRRPQ